MENDYLAMEKEEEERTQLKYKEHPKDFDIPVWPLQMPDGIDSLTDLIPAGTTNLQGESVVARPKLLSVTGPLFHFYRLEMYDFLNKCLRSGRLDHLMGEKVLDRKITAQICTFPYVHYWEIDRENFYADIEVELRLKTLSGRRIWKGYLTAWCCFEDMNPYDKQHLNGGKHRRNSKKLIVEIQELSATMDHEEEGYDRLDTNLIPYYTNQRIDEVMEEFLKEYLPGALAASDETIALVLADFLGLTIMYLPVYEHRGVTSILFFKDSELLIGKDHVGAPSGAKIYQDGQIRRVKVESVERVIIPANTIVVNENKVRWDYSFFHIFHEIFHYLKHYLFYCLQEMDFNDRRKVSVEYVKVEKGKKLKDPLYLMENQADRGAMATMLPATHTRYVIEEERQMILERYRESRSLRPLRHVGDLYEQMILSLHNRLRLPYFRIKMRMVQLGYIEARGAMNYVDKRRITAFSFNRDAWDQSEQTFVISEKDVRALMERSEPFRELIESGEYVYADGRVVWNRREFVYWDEYEGRLMLTELANARVDRCCLRFVRKYVQKNIGQYYYGRMFYDPHYVERSTLFLKEYMDEQGLSFPDARYEYEDEFPDEFRKALNQVMRTVGISQEDLAYELGVTDRTFRNWLKEPKRYFTVDVVTKIALLLELPDFISQLLMERLDLRPNRKNPRNRALEYLRTVKWDQGVKEGDQYLADRDFETLMA